MKRHPRLERPRGRLLIAAMTTASFTTLFVPLSGISGSLSLSGIHVVPHQQSKEMRYRRPVDFSLGARVELFLKNQSGHALSLSPSPEIRLRGKTADELLESDEWAWTDLPSGDDSERYVLPANALTVWSWNGKRESWGVSERAEMTVRYADSESVDSFALRFDEPKVWIASLTFLGAREDPYPDSLIFHINNESPVALKVESCSLWVPANPENWRAFHQSHTLEDALVRFPDDGWILPTETGGARVNVGKLPLTYGVLEVRLIDGEGSITTLWAHQRIKREVFDIGGGWLAERLGEGNTLHATPYLQTLSRMHINAGMHQEVSGYSDTALFEEFPLKYTNRLEPIERYDNDEVLPRIHAVEFLGEPQYGGGTPVSPEDVRKAFLPYKSSRLPTSVTHSEERVWRFYAGLSDYPHYDAYRVNAPAADSWTSYDRWGGERIRWGAPLETIGTMTRSLRELNRPRPIAYWSQGAHSWGRQGGRERNSPTPDELRSQAYQGLANRITSLYWFNLSLESLCLFPDLIDPITRINRECRLLESLILEGAAFEYRREELDGRPQWDLSSITGPRGGIFFVNDLAYHPNHTTKRFEFHRRDGVFQFELPAYLDRPAEVFRLGENGLEDIPHETKDGRLLIKDQVHVAGIYLVSPSIGLRRQLDRDYASLIEHENRHKFDPAKSDTDLEILKGLRQAD